MSYNQDELLPFIARFSSVVRHNFVQSQVTQHDAYQMTRAMKHFNEKYFNVHVAGNIILVWYYRPSYTKRYNTLIFGIGVADIVTAVSCLIQVSNTSISV